MLKNCLPHPEVFTFSTDKSSNFDTLKNLQELENTRFVTMDQVHRSEFRFIEPITSAEIYDSHIFGVDALITTIPGITLAVKHADCLPILVYHPKGIIAAIHAGRRSTQQQILKKVLRYLKTHFQLKDSVSLWFGPALCKDCHTTNPEKTTHFDLIAENRNQTEQIFGSGNFSITVTNRCTAHEDEFHSYRKTGPGVPMNWSTITLI